MGQIGNGEKIHVNGKAPEIIDNISSVDCAARRALEALERYGSSSDCEYSL